MKQGAVLLVAMLLIPSLMTASLGALPQAPVTPGTPPDTILGQLSPGPASDMRVPSAPEPYAISLPAQKPRADPVNYSDVLLVINNQSQISMQIGSYFKQKRNIDDRNVCNISMLTSEYVSPAQAATIRGAIAAYINSSGQNGTLNYIVTTKGVPLGISDANYQYASFDDELALIMGKYSGQTGNNYWMNNPFYNSNERFSRARYGVFIVTRLAGYDFNDCRRLIDNAANSTGVRGRFVLDSQPWKDGGGYQSGNDWCRMANQTLVKKGYNVVLDDTSWYVVNQVNASGYGSWGSNDGNAGNNAKPNFTWVPGAIGTTYVSTSARSFAYPPSYGQSLIADLVREGITGVHGNVMEPFLDACARPHILLDRYTRGWTLAESFSAASLTSSWQNCIIGDPKIAPYANQPDPAVFPEDMSVSASPVVESQNITFAARVRNTGGMIANSTVVSVYDGDPAAGGVLLCTNISIAAIAAGENAQIQVPWNTTGKSGFHRIYVSLAVSNETPQLWDGNDRASFCVTVNSRPELMIVKEKFVISDPSPVEGASVFINFTARNTGGFLAVTPVNIHIDGVLAFSNNASLPGYSDWNQSWVLHTNGKPGAHIIKVEVASVPYELNLTNNFLTGELFVRQYGIGISADARSVKCLPGRAALFNITARSLANFGESVTFSISPPPLFWTAVIEPATVVLFPNATTVHRMLVYSPAFATVNDRCNLTVKCTGQSSSIVRELTVDVGVEAVYLLEVTGEPSSASSLPGENTSFKLAVKNLGNGPDTVNISYAAPPGWVVEAEAPSLEIPFQGQSSIMFKVMPARNAMAGRPGKVVLTVLSAGGASYTVSVETDVEQLYGVSAKLTTETVTLEPAQMKDCILTVNNTGNGPDTMSVLVSRGDVTAAVSPSTLMMDAFSELAVRLTVRVPTDIRVQKEDLVISVISTSSLTARTTLRVVIVRPEINIGTETFSFTPASPKAGETVNLKFELKNTGTAGTGAFKVWLLVDSQKSSSILIDDITAGGSVTCSFNWSSVQGTHNITVAAELEIPDLTVADNSVGQNINVAPKPLPPPPNPISGGGGSGLAMAGGAVALIAVVGVVALMAMRKKTPPAPSAETENRHSGIPRPDAGGAPDAPATGQTNLLNMDLPRDGKQQ